SNRTGEDPRMALKDRSILAREQGDSCHSLFIRFCTTINANTATGAGQEIIRSRCRLEHASRQPENSSYNIITRRKEQQMMQVHRLRMLGVATVVLLALMALYSPASARAEG